MAAETDAVEAVLARWEKTAADFEAMHERAPHLHGDRERVEHAQVCREHAAEIRAALASRPARCLTCGGSRRVIDGNQGDVETDCPDCVTRPGGDDRG